MKREILFRGARVCDGHFVNGSLVEVNGEWVELITRETYIPSHWRPIELK